MSQMGPDLEQLAAKALDLGLRRFSEGEQRPFILFHTESGQPQQIVMDDRETQINSSLVESARQVVTRTLDRARRYAIIYDGYLTISGNQRDATFVEAGERGAPEAFVLAQPYRLRKKRILPQKKKRAAFVKLGPQLVVARVAPLLS